MLLDEFESRLLDLSSSPQYNIVYSKVALCAQAFMYDYTVLNLMANTETWLV